MPRIPEESLQCVFYLYETEDDAIYGVQTGGTGFFVGVQSTRFPERSDVYAITCKHIVKPQEGTGFVPSPVIRLNTRLGNFDTIPLETRDWYTFEEIFPDEKHDIAIHELGSIHSDHIVVFILRPQLSSETEIKKYEVGVGDDVFMVGRYIDHDGRQRNRPSVRFGNISMMPDESERLYHWEGYEEVSYIVEMRSVSGYSGSPVYAYELGFEQPLKIKSDMKTAVLMRLLLGMQWSQPPHEEYHAEMNRYIKVYAGMSNVIPAWYIDRMLDWEVFKMHRKENDEKYAQEQEKKRTQLPTGANRETKPLTKEAFHEVLRKVSRPDQLAPDEETPHKPE